MAGVKTERATAGHKSQPRRPKDWVAPTKTIVVRLPKGAVPSIPTAPITERQPETDAEKAAVTAYNAACKALGQCKPNDRGAENARVVAYQRLVQLGLRPQVRGRVRG